MGMIKKPEVAMDQNTNLTLQNAYTNKLEIELYLPQITMLWDLYLCHKGKPDVEKFC